MNDITTTPSAPPQFEECQKEAGNEKRSLAYPVRFKGMQEKGYPDLTPLISPLSQEELFRLALRVAQSESWNLLTTDVQRFRLEAVATTPRLKFKDDIVVEVRKERAGSSLHMRSKSRLGRGDLGANADRIRSFLSKVKKSA